MILLDCFERCPWVLLEIHKFPAEAVEVIDWFIAERLYSFDYLIDVGLFLEFRLVRLDSNRRCPLALLHFQGLRFVQAIA